ncbi:ATP-binding protein [Amycolatopsis camponoti]|nr:ATP-binding protein [Amycolatopsis camponoti]
MFRVRLLELISTMVRRNRTGPFAITAGYGSPQPAPRAPEPVQAAGVHPAPNRQGSLTPAEPQWRFDQLVLPGETTEMLLDCLAFVQVAPTVFDRWNLRSIEPHPSVAINFRGPPGTGKTMAAHAVAHRLNRGIIMSRLSDLESKYHGDGPKNVVNLFESAAAQNAVLFVDEAESLLSRRFSQPDQAAESAINSMRTELLMALDAFDGLVIFATNLQGSYDTAISSRLTHVDFHLPGRQARKEIWSKHLPAELPLAADVDVDALAAIDGVTGRDIKEAVLRAAVSAARRGMQELSMELLTCQIRRIRSTGADDVQPATGAPDLVATKAEIDARLTSREPTNTSVVTPKASRV